MNSRSRFILMRHHRHGYSWHSVFLLLIRPILSDAGGNPCQLIKGVWSDILRYARPVPSFIDIVKSVCSPDTFRVMSVLPSLNSILGPFLLGLVFSSMCGATSHSRRTDLTKQKQIIRRDMSSSLLLLYSPLWEGQAISKVLCTCFVPFPAPRCSWHSVQVVILL